jgi:hypothetical protein
MREAARHKGRNHHQPSIPSTCKEQDMLNGNAPEINSGSSGLYSDSWYNGNQQSAISNQQSAISNQQSAISNQQSAISKKFQKLR